jgi:hypothetical protein
VSRRLPLALAALSVLAAGCGPAAHAAKAARTVVASPSPTAASPSAAPPAAAVAVDPLTGTAPKPSGSVVVIKVDNGSLARPYQRGLGRAAIVYQELVESGETRFAAVFSTASTGEVGPVRSVRESDIELLRQYGKVPVAFSGGNSGVKATFHAAVRSGYLLDASYDAVPGDYRLAERRKDARNFFTSPAALAASQPGQAARDVGLRFGPLSPAAGVAAMTAKAVFSSYVTVRVQYVPETHAWAVFQDGREMPGVGPANVIVQRVPIRMSRYVDVLGNRTPYTVTTGTGAATVLRDGVAISGTWQRPSEASGTHYVDAAGKDIRLRTGPTWVLLLPTSGSLTLG